MAVEDGEGIAFAGDEQATAVAVDAGGLAVCEGGGGHDVVPNACGGIGCC